MVTRWEVQDAVWASQIEPAGKFIMIALLSRPTGDSVIVEARYAPNFDELASMTGYSRSTISDWMKALAAAGWYERSGGATRAAGGYVLAVGESVVRLPKRVRRPKDESFSPVTGLKDQAEDGASRPKKGHPLVRQPDQRTSEAGAFGPVTGSHKSGSQTKASPVTGLKAEAPIRNLPTGDAVPTDSPSSPSPGGAPVNDGHASAPGWKAADKKTVPPAVVAQNPAHGGRQLALVAKPKRMPERVEIIYDWLRTNGYPEVTPDDATAVHVAVSAAYGTRVTPGYLRKMASLEGGGFVGFYVDHRRQRGAEVDRAIRELERTKPECEHGTAAGRELHPTHGVPLCPKCRVAAPAAADVDDVTAPEVAAALDAYFAARAGAVTSYGLVQLTQQAEALRAGGANSDQLAELARSAAAHNTDLFTAATTRRDA